eukprot:TRINITY_DN11374_c0_g1_i1.p1 TRINITY_DN11374_c0_g1~~TRINITY_DN11374_c0_g1_i1.p1  ORF type:complete len:105 (-),score=22.48 TRINITY_DN11374_c0_g1_i1:10-324(-)
MGAAMAQHIGFMLKVDESFNSLSIGGVHLITFGSPRWASKDLILHFETVIDSHWRIINEGDIIPDLPTQTAGIYGFYHSATAILYTDYKSLTYRVCNDSSEEGH